MIKLVRSLGSCAWYVSLKDHTLENWIRDGGKPDQWQYHMVDCHSDIIKIGYRKLPDGRLKEKVIYEPKEN